jgi:hypothetical protein
MSTERNYLFYIANLGSEVSRYLDCVEKGVVSDTELAWSRIGRITRSLESLPLTESARIEVATLLAFIEKPAECGASVAEIKKQCNEYFMPFALRLMIS